MKKFRILYIVSNLSKTGPILQLFNIVKYLDRNTFEPIVLTISPEDTTSMIDKFLELDVKIDSLNMPKRVFPKKSTYLDKVLKFDPHIVHSHGLRPDFIVASLPEGCCAKFSTAHCDPFEDYPRMYGVAGILAAGLHIKVWSRIQNLIACSGSLSSKLYTKYRLKSSIILNSSDIRQRFMAEIDHRKEFSQKASDKKYTFIFVGVLVKIKNLYTLLDVFRELEDEVKLVVIGDGAERKKLEKVAPNNVVFLGWQRDVAPFLTEADAFISLSLSEGLPTAVLEALALGKPVILSNIPAHSEIMLLAESERVRIGTLVEPTNIQSICEVIKSFTHEEFDHRAIEKFFERHFSPDIMSEKYQRMYIEEISKTRR
uniref:Glycosyltransferase n=1 Tax=Fervidobacterium pennivorans TaxID=93466 RepID=A0A7V4KBG1_FERPE